MKVFQKCKRLIEAQVYMIRPLCFIHLPRTGGKTIRSAFMRSYRPEHLINCGKSFPTDFAALAKRITSNTRVIHGHLNFGLHTYSSVRYVTVLRDPLDRMLSWYRYFRAREAKLGRPPMSFSIL